MNTNRMWTIGSLLLSAVILAGGWFIGVSPMLAQVATADRDRAVSEDQNRLQEAALADLESRFAELASLESQLENERESLPAEDDNDAFLANVNGLQASSGATVTNVAVSDAVPYIPLSPEPVADAPVEETPTDGAVPDGTVDAAADPVPVAAVGEAASVPNAELLTPENFVAIPISVSVKGSVDQVMAFIDGLQSSERVFLVSALDVSYDESEQAFTAVIDGFNWVLLDATAGDATAGLPGAPTTIVN